MPTPYRRNARTPAGRISATPSTANWGGLRGLLSQYPGAAAGYSLRSIGSGPVVKLRRASDNDEKDFTAAELTGSVTGAELVTNGGFDTDSDWAKGSGWSITGGQAVCDGTQVSNSQLAQKQVGNDLIASGSTHGVLTFTISACSDFGSAGFRIATNSVFYKLDDLGITTTGTYTLMFVIGSTASRFNFFTESGVTMTLDDVSCKTYTATAAEEWTFVGAGGYGRQTIDAAYVRSWYDQSGSGNHAGQSTANAQPKLITAGVTETENGKPAIMFDGSHSLNTSGGAELRTASHCMFTVSQSSDGQFILTNSSSSTGPFGWIAQGNTSSPYSSYGTPTIHTNGVLSTPTNRLEVRDVYANGSQVLNTTLNADTSSWSGFNIVDYSASFSYDGTMQELIIYPSDQSTNRVGIETNINDHYGIY